ncbi:MAG: hypothetical protein ACRELS_19365 [Candidatus Rokuibacteriota bacterium]
MFDGVHAYPLKLRPIALAVSFLLGCLAHGVAAEAQPAISVSATVVPPGGSITVTLTNSPGNRTDWLALFSGGAPDDSTGQIQYVS